MFCPVCHGVLTSGGKCFHGKLRYKRIEDDEKKLSLINSLRPYHSATIIAAHCGITLNDIRRLRNQFRAANKATKVEEGLWATT